MGDLQAYLAKKYGAVKKLDLKKKVKKKKPLASGALMIVDNDAEWQKEVQLEPEAVAEDAPVVVEDDELTRSKRTELLRRRTLVSIGEEGGGWVEVTDSEKKKARHDTPDLSPARHKPEDGGGSGSPDMSPPRQGVRHDLPENSALKKREASPDMSPPRRTAGSPDLSPRRRRPRHDSPDPVKVKIEAPDLTPPRRRGKEPSGSPDLPPRRRGARHDSPDPPSPRRLAEKQGASTSSLKKVKEEDLTPPRRKTRGDSDLSPPRRASSPKRGRRDGKDLSPPRRRQTSPPRKRGRRDLDLSPPRKIKQEPKDLTPPRRSGLKSASELREEIEMKRAQDDKRFRELDPSESGRGAETVYRKHGKRVLVDELVKQKKGPEKPPEKPLEWGSGLVQKREVEMRLREFEAEAEKPFARRREDLDEMQRNRVRFGDPMAHLVKPSDSLLLEDFSRDEKMKESGFNVPQNVPAHSWIKRRLPAAPNRYGIRPGRHWDGVDRSNGFEAKVFNAQSQKKAELDMAYKWSVQDM